MSVWQPVDDRNMGTIFHNTERFEIFQSTSKKFWYRMRSDQEVAELRVLRVEFNPSTDRLDNALKIAPL